MADIIYILLSVAVYIISLRISLELHSWAATLVRVKALSPNCQLNVMSGILAIYLDFMSMYSLHLCGTPTPFYM